MTQHKILYTLIGIALLVSLFFGVNRLFWEAHNRTVELVVPLDDLKMVARMDGVYLEEALLRLHAKTDVTSIAIVEDTLESLQLEGKVSYLTGSDVINENRSNRGQNWVLQHLPQSVYINSDTVYIIVDQFEIFERIKQQFSMILGSYRVTDLGFNVLSVRAELSEIERLGLGISPSDIDKITSAGFQFLPRLMNNYLIDADSWAVQINKLSRLGNFSTIIFDGEEVCGYPMHIATVARKIRQNNKVFGLIEFVEQAGAHELASALPVSTVRVHSVSAEEIGTLSPVRIAQRYIRSVKERRIQILYCHLFQNRTANPALLDFNLNFLDRLGTKIKTMKYSITPYAHLDFKSFKPPKSFSLMLISTGIMSCVILLILQFQQLNQRVFLLLLVASSFGSLILFLAGLSRFTISSFALLGACVIPPLAVILPYPRYKEILDIKSHFTILDGFNYILRVTLIALAGGLMIATLLYSPSYLTGINQFAGIKVAFLVPVLIIGCYYYFRPSRIKSINYILRKINNTPITFGVLSLILFITTLVSIYILRSGNYFPQAILPFEEGLRSMLENLFFARPRTKEFAIGYPLLFLSVLCIPRPACGRWIWLMAILGALAPISIINSFCHMHTPLSITLLRSVSSLGLGMFFALLIWAGLETLLRFKRK